MNQKVTEYIAKQKSPQKEICEELRKIFFKNFPNVCAIPEDSPNDLMRILNKQTYYVHDEVYIDEP